MKLLIIFYGIFPALFGISLAYLIKKPEDCTGPVIMLPIMLILTIIIQYYGKNKFEKDKKSDLRLLSLTTRIGGITLGVVVFFMGYFILIK